MERLQRSFSDSSINYLVTTGPVSQAEKEYLLRKGLILENSIGDVYGEASTLSFHLSHEDVREEEKTASAVMSIMELLEQRPRILPTTSANFTPDPQKSFQSIPSTPYDQQLLPLGTSNTNKLDFSDIDSIPASQFQFSDHSVEELVPDSQVMDTSELKSVFQENVSDDEIIPASQDMYGSFRKLVDAVKSQTPTRSVGSDGLVNTFLSVGSTFHTCASGMEMLDSADEPDQTYHTAFNSQRRSICPSSLESISEGLEELSDAVVTMKLAPCALESQQVYVENSFDDTITKMDKLLALADEYENNPDVDLGGIIPFSAIAIQPKLEEFYTDTRDSSDLEQSESLIENCQSASFLGQNSTNASVDFQEDEDLEFGFPIDLPGSWTEDYLAEKGLEDELAVIANSSPGMLPGYGTVDERLKSAELVLSPKSMSSESGLFQMSCETRSPKTNRNRSTDRSNTTPKPKTPLSDDHIFKTPAIPSSKTPRSVGLRGSSNRASYSSSEKCTKRGTSPRMGSQDYIVSSTPNFKIIPFNMDSPASTIGYPTPPPKPVSGKPNILKRAALRWRESPKAQGPIAEVGFKSPPVVLINSPVVDYVYSTPSVLKIQRIPDEKTTQSMSSKKIVSKSGAEIPLRFTTTVKTSAKRNEISPTVKKECPKLKQTPVVNKPAKPGMAAANVKRVSHCKIEIIRHSLNQPRTSPRVNTNSSDVNKEVNKTLNTTRKEDFRLIEFAGSDKVRNEDKCGEREFHFEDPMLLGTANEDILPLPIIVPCATSNKENKFVFSQRHTGMLSESGSASVVSKEHIIKSFIPCRIGGGPTPTLKK